MVEITGSGISKNYIKVYGMHGTFQVAAASGEPISVRYFNTVASMTNEGPAGNSLDLLRQLKPMRERVKASELRDLKSLLQRDLNDYRVANELIPYLQGHRSSIGFFPAILVTLVPSEYLSHASSPDDYPTTFPENDAIESYSDKWKLERYSIDNTVTSLGMLSIDPDSAELVVLDGQHRANAFRFMANTFDQAVGSTIYSAFYKNVTPPSAFEAELPVTIVWFESSAQAISPTLISRRLFVDVNSNAQPVSESRQILLNDSHVPAIATAQLFSQVAEESGFAASEFSLLHTGFDCDGDYPKDFPRTALVSPATLHYMFNYLFYSADRYDDLDVKIQRESRFENVNRVLALSPGITTEQTNLARAGNPDALASIEQSLREDVCPYIARVLREFRLFVIHYSICKQLEDQVNSHGGGEGLHREVWERVFAGGEGLYTSFKRLEDGGGNGSKGKYNEAIEAIDNKFVELRKEMFPGNEPSFLQRAFSTLQTKAGIAGLFMTLNTMAQRDGWSEETVASFLKALNSRSDNEWLHILATFKPAIARELSPKLWPLMRGLFLRVVQDSSGVEYFPVTPSSDAEWSQFAASPDAQLVAADVKTRYERWWEDQEQDDPSIDEDEIGIWKDEALERLKDVLGKCGLGALAKDSVLKERMDNVLKEYITDESHETDDHELEDEQKMPTPPIFRQGVPLRNRRLEEHLPNVRSRYHRCLL